MGTRTQPNLIVRNDGHGGSLLHNPAVKDPKIRRSGWVTGILTAVLGAPATVVLFARPDWIDPTTSSAAWLLISPVVAAAAALFGGIMITDHLAYKSEVNSIRLNQVPDRYRTWVLRSVKAADRVSRTLGSVPSGPAVNELSGLAGSLASATWRLAGQCIDTEPLNRLEQLANKAGTDTEQAQVQTQIDHVASQVEALTVTAESAADQIIHLARRSDLEASLVALDPTGYGRFTDVELTLRAVAERLDALAAALDEVRDLNTPAVTRFEQERKAAEDNPLSDLMADDPLSLNQPTNND